MEEEYKAMDGKIWEYTALATSLAFLDRIVVDVSKEMEGMTYNTNSSLVKPLGPTKDVWVKYPLLLLKNLMLVVERICDTNRLAADPIVYRDGRKVLSTLQKLLPLKFGDISKRIDVLIQKINNSAVVKKQREKDSLVVNTLKKTLHRQNSRDSDSLVPGDAPVSPVIDPSKGGKGDGRSDGSGLGWGVGARRGTSSSSLPCLVEGVDVESTTVVSGMSQVKGGRSGALGGAGADSKGDLRSGTGTGGGGGDSRSGTSGGNDKELKSWVSDNPARNFTVHSKRSDDGKKTIYIPMHPSKTKDGRIIDTWPKHLERLVMGSANRLQFQNSSLPDSNSMLYTVYESLTAAGKGLQSKMPLTMPYVVPETSEACPFAHSLTFDSEFDSGNLLRAVQRSDASYDLFLRSDLHTAGHTQWFYFAVSNTHPPELVRLSEQGVQVPPVRVTFNIVNFTKPDSLFNMGMRPVVYSCMDAAKCGTGWVRAGTDISYYGNNFARNNAAGEGVNFYYTLTLTIEFHNPKDTVLIAYTYPYTYDDYTRHIGQILAKPGYADVIKQMKLCRTLGGVDCDLLAVTNFKDKDKERIGPISMQALDASQERGSHPMSKRDGGGGGSKGGGSKGVDTSKYKPALFLSARVHPGETPASWMMKGILDFITSDSPQAALLRQVFVIFIVPMLNPDGVIYGNNRCSLAGVDLNRQWKVPSKMGHPTVFGLKQFMIAQKKVRDAVMYVDLHGHSRKYNVFMYGCDDKKKPKPQVRTFPKFFSMHNVGRKYVSYADCSFNVKKGRESTARVVVAKEVGITNAFTLEATFCGSNYGPLKYCHMNVGHLQEVGAALCDAFLNYSIAEGHVKNHLVVPKSNLKAVQDVKRALADSGNFEDPDFIFANDSPGMYKGQSEDGHLQLVQRIDEPESSALSIRSQGGKDGDVGVGMHAKSKSGSAASSGARASTTIAQAQAQTLDGEQPIAKAPLTSSSMSIAAGAVAGVLAAAIESKHLSSIMPHNRARTDSDMEDLGSDEGSGDEEDGVGSDAESIRTGVPGEGSGSGKHQGLSSNIDDMPIPGGGKNKSGIASVDHSLPMDEHSHGGSSCTMPPLALARVEKGSPFVNMQVAMQIQGLPQLMSTSSPTTPNTQPLTDNESVDGGGGGGNGGGASHAALVRSRTISSFSKKEMPKSSSNNNIEISNNHSSKYHSRNNSTSGPVDSTEDRATQEAVELSAGALSAGKIGKPQLGTG